MVNSQQLGSSSQPIFTSQPIGHSQSIGHSQQPSNLNVNEILHGTMIRSKPMSTAKPPQTKNLVQSADLCFDATSVMKPKDADVRMGPYYDDSFGKMIYKQLIKSRKAIHEGMGSSQNTSVQIGTNHHNTVTDTRGVCGSIWQLGVFNEEFVGQPLVNLGFKAPGLKWAGHPYVTNRH
ncbi:hypothetical protein GH714_034471 [Hevea brasiliensis]|uniref:Uncharacterized protein n=1 Tax=Hevea brasiliensis TaxID=3981 RepID=A0A6A6K860_HEVBR|nr:hypothetical protein GH714_034471 [Hevea brasiliensis]